MITNVLLKTLNIEREISNAVQINSDWTEIIAEPPLEIFKQFQRISLYVTCLQDLNKEENVWYLEDGTVINPQVQIIDEFENIYELKGGNLSGYFKNSDTFVASKLGFSYRLRKLPTDRKYTTIRVRNDQSFLCSKITWLNYQMK
jgi:hypothetical protein